LSAFVGYLEANIAREVGRHIGWRGPFWERRFSAEPILKDDALIGRMRYLLGHGVKEGLVESAEAWPGLTCLPELAHGVTRLFPWYDRTKQWWARVRGSPCDEARFMTSYRVDIVPLPCWTALEPRAQLEAAGALVAEANEEAKTRRGDKPALGVDAVCAQDPFSSPQVVKRSPRPLCHAASREARVAFRRMYREVVHTYREASALFRAGAWHVAFPAGTFRPRVPIDWRAAAATAATG
jgi:hypothetical protein